MHIIRHTTTRKSERYRRMLTRTWNKSLVARSAVLRRCFASAAGHDDILVVEREGPVAIVRMNRPPANLLNTKMMQALDKQIGELEKDKSCRGMILASTNQKIFSAGLDIHEMYQPEPTKLRKFWTAMQDLNLHLYTTRLATIAAIEGHSPAGGCILSIACDYRVMATGKPQIGLNETQLGIVAPKWLCENFVNVIGQRQAEKMLGLGLRVDAVKAQAIGLVDDAVDLEQVMPTAHDAMKKWLAIPDAARVLTKKRLREKTTKNFVQMRQEDLEAFCDFIQTDRTQKSLEMYLASLKRK